MKLWIIPLVLVPIALYFGLNAHTSYVVLTSEPTHLPFTDCDAYYSNYKLVICGREYAYEPAYAYIVGKMAFIPVKATRDTIVLKYNTKFTLGFESRTIHVADLEYTKAVKQYWYEGSPRQYDMYARVDYISYSTNNSTVKSYDEQKSKLTVYPEKVYGVGDEITVLGVKVKYMHELREVKEMMPVDGDVFVIDSPQGKVYTFVPRESFALVEVGGKLYKLTLRKYLLGVEMET
ncbi:MAG: hypothetical protein DRJ18_00350 [Candidatus Methanomethylicota archaeon]|nr:MAG: hypothetical protein DRJ18_00350 [Candidatus Verstraetearchaeota archaeon]